MRKYEKPNMEILLLDNFEVITTSATTPSPVLNPNGNSKLDTTDWGAF